MSKTHFGYQSVDEAEKAGKVAEVFHSVANKYDVMNDLMSFGLHRVWKKITIARANVRPGQKILDIAGGTGDLAAAFAKATEWGRNPDAQVWLSDINASMLGVGRDRLLDRGVALPCVQFDAEKIPLVREMIIAQDYEHRMKAIAKLKPLQTADFKELFSLALALALFVPNCFLRLAICLFIFSKSFPDTSSFASSV